MNLLSGSGINKKGKEKKMKKTRKIYGGFTEDISDVQCEYCGQTPDETEIQEAYASSTYICGDIECWNSYCWDWVWTGNVVEITEVEYEVCDECEEEDCICEEEE
tara:strand:- start:1022 stop:1336 length:315 start_codon:yes stop_codon:yes gene_type:complete